MPIVPVQCVFAKTLRDKHLVHANSAADQSGETKKRPLFATGREKAPG